MGCRTAFSALFLAVAAGVSGLGQSAHVDTRKPSVATIVYRFDHPQLQPAHYTITVDQTGTGRFVSQPGPAPVAISDAVYPAPLNRPVQLDPQLLASLFGYARAHDYFTATCASRRTNLAFTGNKSFTYNGPDGRGSCSFVWAEDPALQRLSEQLGAVALTLEFGRRLGVEVEHDRLSLDSELESLQNAVRDHRAEDLGNIAPQLQMIAADRLVMDRARKRAEVLLSHCANLPKQSH